MLAFFGGTLPAQAEPALRLLSNTEWEAEAEWFGGFSGLEMSQDGMRMTLLTDRGTLVQAEVFREGGLIHGLGLTSYQPLLLSDGTRPKKMSRDSEGLVLAPDGKAFVSFEHQHRVARLNLQTGRIIDLPRHPEFAKFADNRGLEALAVHPDGRLFALSEGRGYTDGTAPIYTFADAQWQVSHRVPVSGPFRAVGADFDDRKRLYLLERAITPLGFRSQIRRIDLSQTPVTAETLLTTYPAAFDNLEALSVWQDETGATRLALISDDNFLSLQTTQVLEFLLIE